MAPSLGDTVFVNEADPLTDEDNVSVGIVTHVLSDKDSGGDTGWWNAVKASEPVQVTLLRRNGTTESLIVTKGDTVQDDEGRDRWQSGTYSTSADGPAQPVQDQAAPVNYSTVPESQTPPGDPATAASTQAGDRTIAAQSGAQTNTGPGWTPSPGQ